MLRKVMFLMAVAWATATGAEIVRDIQYPPENGKFGTDGDPCGVGLAQ